MKVIVCGSRKFADWERFCQELTRLLGKLDKAKLVILSGHAYGPDLMGERWARDNRVTCEIHWADWERHGKAAGAIRNSAMIAAKPDAVVTFWDGVSAGTSDLLAKARKAGLKVKVVRVKTGRK